MENIYQTSTEKGNVCFVVLPFPLESQKLWWASHGFMNFCDNEGDIDSILLPPSHKWKVIGGINEVRQVQAATIINFDGTNYLDCYGVPCKPSTALKIIARSLGIPEDKKTIVLFEPKKRDCNLKA